MRPSGTVLGTLPRALVAYAEALHAVPAGALYADAGIDPAPLFADPDARVPRRAVDALWAAVEARTGDRALGVNFAQRLPAGNAGVFEYMVSSCATVGEAWAYMLRYWRLLNEDADLRLERRDDLRIVLRPADGVPFHPQWIEFTVAVLALAARPLQSEGRRGFTEVCLPHARTDAHDALEALVPAPVRYARAAMEIGVPHDHAALPLPSANPSLRDVLARHAEEQLARLAQPSPEGATEADLLARVRAQIAQRLAHGDATLEGVARALGTSARSLQRHLATHATSHRELLDEARHAVALRHLSSDAMSVTDVAFVLGFSEVSAFHRAFRRWTGMAPSEFRAARAAPASSASASTR